MNWTTKQIADRLEEAADTLKRLPDKKVGQRTGYWPDVVHDFWEAYGWTSAAMRLGPPAPDAIDRMDETLGWLRWLEGDDAKIVWMRACGTPWKILMRRFDVGRTTLWQRWTMGLIIISTKLGDGSQGRGRGNAAA